MTKQEFLTRVEREQLDLGGTRIETEYLTESPHVLGCYYNNNIHKWQAYETFERGGYSIIDEYDDENQAFDEFYIMVRWEARSVAKIKEQLRRGERL